MDTATPVSQPTEQVSTRSSFITVLGWLTAVLSGFGAIMTALLFVLVAFVMPELDEAFAGLMANTQMDSWMADDWSLWLLFWGGVSVVGVFVGVGLLRRRNWARVSSMIYLGIVVVWQLYATSSGSMVMPDMGGAQIPPDLSPELTAQIEMQMQLMTELMTKVMIGFTIATGIFHVWMIYKLNSKPIKAEFGVASGRSSDSQG